MDTTPTYDGIRYNSYQMTHQIQIDPTGNTKIEGTYLSEGNAVADLIEASRALSGDQMVFNYKIEIVDAMVKINANLDLKIGDIQQEYYVDVKRFFETITSKLQEPVVPKKVANH